MMDPNHPLIAPQPSDISDDPEEQEDVEEELDGDVIGGEGTGTSANEFLRVTGPRSSQEVLVLEGASSEDGGDVRECSSQGNDDTGGSTESLNGGDEVVEKFNRGEIEGLFCPICFEAWSTGGDHRICCLPCGHIYGLSCIKRWLSRQSSSKCPQCKKKCNVKGIRLLYATRVVAIDGELQKKVRCFEAKCVSLEKKDADLAKKEVEWKKKEAGLQKQLQYLEERTHDLENLLEDMENKPSESATSSSNCSENLIYGVHSEPVLPVGGFDKFQMQENFQIQGARLFDIDSSNKVLVFYRRLSCSGGAHMLTKVRLFSNQNREDIRLPDAIRAVKDLKVSPHGGLVLLASLGKRLSVLSTQSNNNVITYNLPAPAWSCSWDINNSHYSYAGLQNGTVLQFDMRQTASHVESLAGSTGKLIHTLHSLPSDSSCSSGIRSVLTASALGLCQLNFGLSEERPYVVPESDNQGVCISLAYSNVSDYILASYRPKIGLSDNPEVTQATQTAVSQAAEGSHVLYRKMGSTYRKLGASCCSVSSIRVPVRSAIIDRVCQNPVFASGDESKSELIFKDLPSQMVIKRLKPMTRPIYDVNFRGLLSLGVLGCLTENYFHLYSANLLP